MRAAPAGSRRLTGGHITLIAVAVCATLAPTAVYAADRVLSYIADPHDSSAVARVSQDGRLGIRGETIAQQGVPMNEWHGAASGGRLLRSAPPGSGIGVSQITVENLNRTSSGFVRALLLSATVAGECPRDRSTVVPSVLYEAYVPIPPDQVVRSEQFVFPVPLTLRAAPKQTTCLYADVDHHGATVRANGISGPMTPAFVAPAGTNSPTAEGDPANQPAIEVQP